MLFAAGQNLLLHPWTVAFFDFIRQWPFVGALFALTVLDILSGFIAAFNTKKLSSSVSWAGMTRKAGQWIIIAVAVLIGQWIPQMPIAQIVALYYIGHEGLSILENLGSAGVPFPPALKEALVKMSEDKRANKLTAQPTPADKPLVIERTVERHIIERDPVVTATQEIPAFDPSLITQTDQGPAIRMSATTPNATEETNNASANDNRP